MSKKIFTSAKRPLLFAHRGVSSLAPENTLAAFRKVRELEIPGVELDVHLTKDGYLVVIHDESIKRTGRLVDAKTGEITEAPDVDVEDSNYADLLQYDFGIWKGQEFAGEKIPLLSEVLEVLGSVTYVDVEIKIDTLKCKAVAKKTAEVLTENLAKYPENSDRFLASSFNPRAIREFSKYSDIPTALIYENKDETPWFIKGRRGLLFCTPDVLKPEHILVTGKERKDVCVWTVDNKEDIEGLIEKRVKGFCSNKPQDIRDVLSQFETKFSH